MRIVESAQFEIGSVDIEQIDIDPKARDDIGTLLMGLRHLYVTPDLRAQVFDLLAAEVKPEVRNDTGRPGLDLWRILVLATLKQGLNCDYDSLVDFANNHILVRQMMGHGMLKTKYKRQTVADNVRLLSPELLAKISLLLVESGQKVAGKKPGEKLRGRCDSFCVETDVHFPTDVNLLADAMRCTVRTVARLAWQLKLSGWRQHKHISELIKAKFNRVRTSRQIKKSPERVAEYLDECKKYLMRAENTLSQAAECELTPFQHAKIIEIQDYIEHAKRQISQICRRVINDETIPHHEKVLSIFETHTRWISKGKAGVSQELGVPVAVVEDQFRFILNHSIMWDGCDVDHAQSLIAQTQQRFPDFVACSFDRGFHSPDNQVKLAEMLDECALPRKGYLSAKALEHQSQDWFKEARKKHPGIESAINHLEHCGLDRVLDHGKRGFGRAVALSILAANLKRLGRILREKERKKLARQRLLKVA